MEVRNQKNIDERRFNKLHWTHEDGVYTSCMSKSHRWFGSFYVVFENTVKTGEIAVEIQCVTYKELHKRRTVYADVASALEGVKEFFKEMDELAGQFAEGTLSKAMREYREVIRAEICRIKRV